MNVEKAFIDFLLNGRQSDLQTAALAKMAESRNLKKSLDEHLEKWLRETIEAELLDFFANNREMLGRELGRRSNPFRLPFHHRKPQRISSWRR